MFEFYTEWNLYPKSDLGSQMLSKQLTIWRHDAIELLELESTELFFAMSYSSIVALFSW